jgi:YVTN family beta-propeller protein
MSNKQFGALALVGVFLLLLLLTFPAPAQDHAAKTMTFDSALLVLNKAENTLAILNTQTLGVIGRIAVGEGPHEVITSADGNLAFVGNYGTAQTPGSSLSVIDLVAQKQSRRVELGAFRVIARYDPVADKVDWLLGTGQGATHIIAGNAQQKRLYTANITSATVTMLDLAAQPLTVTQIAVADQPEGIDASPFGKEVWVAPRGSGLVSILDTATKKVVETIKASIDPYRVKFTPDGKRVLISDPQGNSLLVLDAATRKVPKRIPIEGLPAGITVAPDSRRACVTLIQANGIAAIDLESLSVSKKVEPGKGPHGLTWAGK